MKNEITYRKATQSDIEATTNLLSTLYEMQYNEVLEENKKLFTDTNQAFFLAFDGDAPIGVSHGSLRREYVNGTNDDLKGYLEAIFTLPKYRKQGIAAGLVNIAEQWMWHIGCREVASDCALDNIDSYNFHLKIGFKETERCIFFLKKIDPPTNSNLHKSKTPMTVQFTENEVKIMQTALDQWGTTTQVGQTIEECAELIVALQKYVNRTPQPNMIDNILDEIADVEMMLAQMRLVLNIDDAALRKRIEYKFERLNQYLSKDEV